MNKKLRASLLLSGCILLLLSAQAQSQFCYRGAEIRIKGGGSNFSISADEMGESELLRVTVSPLVNRYGYLITDESNTVLRISPTNFVELAGLNTGRYRIWAFSYIGRITVGEGEVATESRLASFCYELTRNFVEVEITGETTAFQLQLLHHSHGASRLRSAGEDLPGVGGVHRFATQLAELRESAAAEGFASVLVSAGDNFGAEKDMTAGLRQGVPFEATVHGRLSYDALAIGNSEFDFGPFALESYLRAVGNLDSVPFLSANLDLSNEPGLEDLRLAGQIRSNAVITRGEKQVGIVAVSPPNLRFWSSPRNAATLDNTRELAQGQIDALLSAGVNKIILISHLRSLSDDLELGASLRGVDILVAGGNDAFLSNDPENEAIPGFNSGEDLAGNYPLEVTDRDGRTVYAVSAPGRYAYIGNLLIEFDEEGEVSAIDPASGPVPIIAVAPDPDMDSLVVRPVQEFIHSLPEVILGSPDIELNASVDETFRRETNFGNLAADALLWQANFFGFFYNYGPVDAAILPAASMPNSVVIPPFEAFSEDHTFELLPQPEFVSVVEAVSPARLKQIMERALSQVENAGDPFVQVGGFQIVYDPDAQAQVTDGQGNITITGERVRSIVLNNGQLLVEDGLPVPGAPSINLVTPDVLARGGNAFPLGDNSFTTIGIPLQQALANYFVFELRGRATEQDYPPGGEGRIATRENFAALPFGPIFPEVQSWTDQMELMVSPNPFAGELDISFYLEQESRTTISLVDLAGRKVVGLIDRDQPAGSTRLRIQLDGTSIPRGTYVLVLQSKNRIAAKLLHH